MVMAKRIRRARSGSQVARESSTVSASDFKARCLELMDRVRETGVEYVITKHGKPVAKLAPHVEPARPSLFGSGRGTVLQYERPFDPIEGEYDIDKA
jgi:prevent-host-death family protein